MSNIHPSIAHLAVPIETLTSLEGNPRKGDVDAIVASYAEFGQVKPVVVKRNDDGTATVIAGNHQVEACRRLGWTEIAVVEFEGDYSRAIAYALADNRTNELGTIDNSLLFEMIGGTEGYDELFDSLGWDMFELTSMEEDYRTPAPDNEYIPPVIRQLDEPVNPSVGTSTQMPNLPNPIQRPDGSREMQAPQSVDIATAVTQGAPSVVNNPTKAVVQYTLVFDNPDQQRRWYDFIRWLKTDPAYDGATTSERLLAFIDAHANN